MEVRFTSSGVKTKQTDYCIIIDMTVQTEGGRIVVMLIILTSLAVLPSLVTDVLATNRKRNGRCLCLWLTCAVHAKMDPFAEGGGHVSSGSMPFILIVGAFRLEQVNEILDGFLNRVSRSCMWHIFSALTILAYRKMQNAI